MGYTVSQDLQATNLIIALLEQAKASTEEIIGDLPDFLAIINESGEIYKSNLAVKTILNLDTDDDVLGKNVSSLFSKQGWLTFVDNLAKVKSTGNAVEFELPIYGDHGVERIIFWNIMRFHCALPSETPLFRVIGRDISISVILTQKNWQLQMQKNRIQAILDSSMQGFFTFNQDFNIESDYSTRAEQLLGNDILGKNLFDVLNFKAGKAGNFSSLFLPERSWDLIKGFSTIETQVQGRTLRIDFAPIFEEKMVKRVLCTVTDITPIKILEQKAEKSEKTCRTIVKILTYKNVFVDMVRPVLFGGPVEWSQLSAKRYVHTLKGEFGFFEFREMVDICEAWEDRWKAEYSKGDFTSFVNQIRSNLNEFLTKYENLLGLKEIQDEEVKISLNDMKSLAQRAIQAGASKEIVDAIEKLAERPVEELLQWLNGTWMMAATALGKKVDPIVWVTTCSIASEPYKKLFATLVHVVRNSADHGIEKPDERRLVKKPEKGKLIAELELNDNTYYLRFKDDGRGVQIEAVKSKAAQVGLTLSDDFKELTNILCHPEFSTRDSINEYSGRGIGLDAIREEARALGGDIRIAQTSGIGFEMEIWFTKVPLVAVSK